MRVTQQKHQSYSNYINDTYALLDATLAETIRTTGLTYTTVRGVQIWGNQNNYIPPSVPMVSARYPSIPKDLADRFMDARDHVSVVVFINAAGFNSGGGGVTVDLFIELMDVIYKETNSTNVNNLSIK